MKPPFVTACPVGCEEPLRTTDIALPEGPLRRCTGCGQLSSQCTEERYRSSMQEFDDEEGTLPKTDARHRRFVRSKRYLEQIEVLLGKPRNAIRLLDVGCSSGYFLGVARQLGFQAEGVEPGERAVRTARAAGLTVHSGLLEDIPLPERSFDAIVLFEVMEHLRDALYVVQRCNRLLRRGGICIIGTGNAASWTFRAMQSRWEYLQIEKHGGHVSFFNPVSMEMLANRSGFVIEKIQTRSVSFCNREDCSPVLYRTAKIICEILEAPARWLGKGHDMLVFMRKRETTH
jgi:2-polyprenyl-3-methyl-5-hydroxy-6-metoxy-1,4-benzoquinol methylase